jgi:hypothetical protein
MMPNIQTYEAFHAVEAGPEEVLVPIGEARQNGDGTVTMLLTQVPQPVDGEVKITLRPVATPCKHCSKFGNAKAAAAAHAAGHPERGMTVVQRTPHCHGCGKPVPANTDARSWFGVVGPFCSNGCRDRYADRVQP